MAAYDLITLAQAKDYLNIGVASADTTQDVWLQSVLSAVSDYVERYCQRKFAVQSVANEIYDGDGTETLQLNYWPLVQLSTATTPSTADKLAAVQFRSDPDGSWTDLTDNVNWILTNPRWTHIALYSGVFLSGVQNIRLNYKAGYSTVPQDLQLLALEAVAITWKESNRGGGRLAEVSSNSNIGGYSVSNTLKDLDPKWKKVLDRYRVGSI
jgi:hypothetical protein